MDFRDAKPFIEKHHYAMSSANTATECFGLYYKGDQRTLHGISWWMPPPLGAAKSVSDVHQTVLSLSRFCLVPSRPHNSGSYLISQSIRMIKPRYSTLLTYAETRLDHTGIIYRASNWTYYGLSTKQPVWINPKNGHQVSRYSGGKTYNKQQMLDKGYIFMGRHQKHKFVYPRNRRGIVQPTVQLQLAFNDEGKIVNPNN